MKTKLTRLFSTCLAFTLMVSNVAFGEEVSPDEIASYNIISAYSEKDNEGVSEILNYMEQASGKENKIMKNSDMVETYKEEPLNDAEKAMNNRKQVLAAKEAEKNGEPKKKPVENKTSSGANEVSLNTYDKNDLKKIYDINGDDYIDLLGKLKNGVSSLQSVVDGKEYFWYVSATNLNNDNIQSEW